MPYRYEATEKLGWFLRPEGFSERERSSSLEDLRQDPFDARLGTHKIHWLSAH
jgi:hypothetical protein